MFTDQQEAQPQDVSRFQAFVRTAARSSGSRPERTWPAPDSPQDPRAPQLPAQDPRIALI